jgi:hypothetical protein
VSDLGEAWVTCGAVNIGEQRYQDGLTDMPNVALG